MARTRQTTRKCTTLKSPVFPEWTPIEGASSVAQDKVLSMPDLLVIILSQLPHSTLLKAKGVNRTWASIFGHTEVQAALFQQPRPKESALYVETHSDILKTMFPKKFWPDEGNTKAILSRKFMGKRFRAKKLPREPKAKRHYSQQWRQLLICQPPIKVLELVQSVSCRGGNHAEFRSTITRPDGLRIGFLYDAIRHWEEFERSSCQLLWNRKSGDPVNTWHKYADGYGFRMNGDEPCITIWGNTSVGCGQYGGLTFHNRASPQTQVIESGDEKVEYRMSEPKLEDSSASLPEYVLGISGGEDAHENND